jgi:hypothetical protein
MLVESTWFRFALLKPSQGTKYQREVRADRKQGKEVFRLRYHSMDESTGVPDSASTN